MFRKLLILSYSGAAYLLALASLAYLVGFLADLAVPKGINDGEPGKPLISLVVNLGLLWLFGLHHSATARQWFKRWICRYIPTELERATYLVMTVVATGALVILWKPIPLTLWQVDSQWGSAAIWAAYLGVWAMMFAATFHFGHFGFFGLKQAWLKVRGAPPPEPSFSARWLYAFIRHPISLGWMLLPWLTPHMTIGQLVFAFGTLVYVMVATVFEEKDLIAELGDAYRDYRQHVPAFLPFLKPR